MANAWISSESNGRVVSDSTGPSSTGEIVFAPLPSPLPLSEQEKKFNEFFNCSTTHDRPESIEHSSAKNYSQTRPVSEHVEI